MPPDAPWDTSPWMTTPWNAGAKPRFGWGTVGGVGNWASLRMKTLSHGAEITLASIDYVGQAGGIL